MERYHPLRPPNPTEWLSLDESVRIDLVQTYLRESGEKIPRDAEAMHAMIHVIVENQIALEIEPVPATMAKLTRQGLSRHEALHAVGAVLSGDIYELLQHNDRSGFRQRYRRRLEKLTAKRWRKNQW
jgi:hypothetical protein